MKKTRLIIFFVLVKFHLFSQDTIHFESRKKFEQLIQFTFNDYTGGLNILLREEIDKEFYKFNFSGNEYDCQYAIDFDIEIDSMGMIKDCKQISIFEDHHLNKFVSKVEKIIENSGWCIQNWVDLSDTSYFIHLVQVNFEISCDPTRLIYQISHSDENNNILVFNDGIRVIYFDGFKNYTKEKKKKCHKNR